MGEQRVRESAREREEGELKGRKGWVNGLEFTKVRGGVAGRAFMTEMARARMSETDGGRVKGKERREMCEQQHVLW